MDAIILQENIEGLLSLVRMLLPDGGSAGCVYLDDLSALQRSIHEKTVSYTHLRAHETD